MEAPDTGRNGQGNPRFRRSAQAELLVQRLIRVSVGERIAYTEMSAVVGVDVRKKYYLIRTAVNALVRDRYFFEVEPGQGLMRVDDPTWITVVGAKAARRLGNLARRTNRKLSYVEREELPTQDDKTTLDAYRTTFTLAEVIHKPKGQNAIRTLCDDAGHLASLAQAAQKLAEIL